MIEIYDINNGKLKYSAYTFWQLCEMVREDFVYHTEDEENDIVWWIELKAKELCRGGRKGEVLKQLDELLAFGQNDGHRSFASRVSLLLGEIAFENGHRESAIEHFQNAVNLFPGHVEALHQLARGFSAMGEYQKAAETWRKANGIFPSEEAYLALSEALEKLKSPQEQEKVLRSLVKNCPGSIKGLHVLTQFYRRRRKSKAAVRLAQRIVDLGPEKGEHYGPFFDELAEGLIWSRYNYESGKVDKVLEFLDEEQERNPDEWVGLLKAVMLYKLDKRLCREECCYELGKYFEAVGYNDDLITDDLRQVVEIFGEEFSRGIVRFIKNWLAKRYLRRARRKSSLSHTRPSAGSSGSEKESSGSKAHTSGQGV